MLAAGGITDGRGLVAALALGADGVVLGTRFVASNESHAHPVYKRRIVEAKAEDTVHTKLFDIGWPDAAHRVLRTKVVEDWERAGCPPTGKRPGEGAPVGKMNRGGLEMPLVRYSVAAPADYVEGDAEQLPFYAGHSVGLTNKIAPAGEIVREIAADARRIIAERLGSLA